ncbi:uncharacterized protein PG998_002629 [Apiospora kogelbergensis]|uniref:uncharacterized protein n=1 Tax=Apiospora kogelbergensis TaxID=1337665 RepID=UPI0031309013
MATSFLSYLRLPNPAASSSECKSGSSTLGSQQYRPDEVKPWEDLTLENLEKTFKDVLEHQMDEPRIRNAREISPERLILYEEGSVRTLAEHWNEQNHGQGHIPNQDGQHQKPDWCVYQKKDEQSTKPCPNLLPGDIKPAKKWKSEWITSSDPTMRRKAYLVLNQITKYMYLGGRRYGFILSEEELVAVRLSMFTRDPEENLELANDGSAAAAHMLDSLQDLEGGPEEDFADAQRRQGRFLEYCGIPWRACGDDSFTVNLTLWWLTVLAVQDARIKSAGNYTSLGSLIRGKSPSWDLPVAEPEAIPDLSPNGDTPGGIDSRSKQADDVSTETPKVKRRRYPRRRPELFSKISTLPATQVGTKATKKRSQDPVQSFTSTVSSQSTKRQRRRASAAYLNTSSFDQSSQAADDYVSSFPVSSFPTT